MKRIQQLFVAGLVLLALEVSGQSYSVIHNFTNNPDGASPQGGLILSNNILYGTTYYGGSASNGVIYKLNEDGSAFTVLHNFSALGIFPTNSDGAHPQCKLALDNGILYGTASKGGYVTNISGVSASGTVFSIDTNGETFSILKYIPPSSPFPLGGLVVQSNILYGTTEGGGNGMVFAINEDGTGFTNLSGNLSGSLGGLYSYAGLIIESNTLYGTSYSGSLIANIYGFVFSINSDGTDFTNLMQFSSISGGGQPASDLVFNNGVLYGTASSYKGGGAIFKMNADGTGFMPINTFVNNANAPLGSIPVGGLVLSGSTLYGTTKWGGSHGDGTVFGIGTDGTGYTILKNFAGSDGANPVADLVLDGNTLYGTTSAGGTAGQGVIFSLTLPPPLLLITNANNSLIIYWVDDGRSHTVQTTTNLSNAVWVDYISTNWMNNLNGATQIGCQVTNPISSTGAFFRLR